MVDIIIIKIKGVHSATEKFCEISQQIKKSLSASWILNTSYFEFLKVIINTLTSKTFKSYH